MPHPSPSPHLPDTPPSERGPGPHRSGRLAPAVTWTRERMTETTIAGSVCICSATERILAIVSFPSSWLTGRLSCRIPASISSHARENWRRCCSQKRRSPRRSCSSCSACACGSTDRMDWRRIQQSSASSSVELSACACAPSSPASLLPEPGCCAQSVG